MQRLIDADALTDDILKSAVMIDDRGIQTGYEIAIELIKRQPTVDAVPVIWCSECYFWDKEPSQTAMPEVHTCRYWRIGTTCVDYCARASEDGWLKAMPKENANEAD